MNSAQHRSTDDLHRGKVDSMKNIRPIVRQIIHLKHPTFLCLSMGEICQFQDFVVWPFFVLIGFLRPKPQFRPKILSKHPKAF